MSKIERYDTPLFGMISGMELALDGEWVKYEDIKHLIKEEDGKEN